MLTFFHYFQCEVVCCYFWFMARTILANVFTTSRLQLVQGAELFWDSFAGLPAERQVPGRQIRQIKFCIKKVCEPSNSLKL